LATAEFAFNNKVYMATKSSPFQVNYGREPRMGFDIRKKGKNEKAEEFAREMKERHEEARAVLVRSQEEMKRQAERVTKKLMEKFIGPYVVRNIVLENVIELELLASLRIHPVVNVGRIVKYRE